MVSVQSPQRSPQDPAIADRIAVLSESRLFASAWTLFWALTFLLLVTAADANVLFFATRPSMRDAMRDALQSFAPTLPARVTLKTAPPCP